MQVKRFIKIGLNEDIELKRKEIRLIKKEISYIEDMKRAVETKSEKDLLEMVKGDEKAYKQYLELSGMIEDKNKKEITRLQKEGKLREVFLDERGKEIESESK
jgi:hypothetical protein